MKKKILDVFIDNLPKYCTHIHTVRKAIQRLRNDYVAVSTQQWRSVNSIAKDRCRIMWRIKNNVS